MTTEFGFYAFTGGGCYDEISFNSLLVPVFGAPVTTFFYEPTHRVRALYPYLLPGDKTP
jgi:hypothetical protein